MNDNFRGPVLVPKPFRAVQVPFHQVPLPHRLVLAVQIQRGAGVLERAMAACARLNRTTQQGRAEVLQRRSLFVSEARHFSQWLEIRRVPRLDMRVGRAYGGEVVRQVVAYHNLASEEAFDCHHGDAVRHGALHVLRQHAAPARAVVENGLRRSHVLMKEKFSRVGKDSAMSQGRAAATISQSSATTLSQRVGGSEGEVAEVEREEGRDDGMTAAAVLTSPLTLSLDDEVCLLGLFLLILPFIPTVLNPSERTPRDTKPSQLPALAASFAVALVMAPRSPRSN